MKIRKTAINDGNVQICIPIVSHTKQDIIRDMKEAYTSEVKIMEWSVDFFKDVKKLFKFQMV